MRHRLGIGMALGAGLLLGAGLARGCATVPSDFTVKVELSDADRARIDALNANLGHLTRAADETLDMFRIPGDNAPAED